MRKLITSCLRAAALLLCDAAMAGQQAERRWRWRQRRSRRKLGTLAPAAAWAAGSVHYHLTPERAVRPGTPLEARRGPFGARRRPLCGCAPCRCCQQFSRRCWPLLTATAGAGPLVTESKVRAWVGPFWAIDTFLI